MIWNLRHSNFLSGQQGDIWISNTWFVSCFWSWDSTKYSTVAFKPVLLGFLSLKIVIQHFSATCVPASIIARLCRSHKSKDNCLCCRLQCTGSVAVLVQHFECELVPMDNCCVVLALEQYLALSSPFHWTFRMRISSSFRLTGEGGNLESKQKINKYFLKMQKGRHFINGQKCDQWVVFASLKAPQTWLLQAGKSHILICHFDSLKIMTFSHEARWRARGREKRKASVGHTPAPADGPHRARS